MRVPCGWDFPCGRLKPQKRGLQPKNLAPHLLLGVTRLIRVLGSAGKALTSWRVLIFAGYGVEKPDAKPTSVFSHHSFHRKIPAALHAHRPHPVATSWLKESPTEVSSTEHKGFIRSESFAQPNVVRHPEMTDLFTTIQRSVVGFGRRVRAGPWVCRPAVATRKHDVTTAVFAVGTSCFLEGKI